MSYLDKTQVFQETALKFGEDMEHASNILKEMGLYAKLREPPVRIDARDFVPMTALMGIQGETREERDQDIRNKFEELTKAFSDSDHSKRNTYLDMLYDYRDTVDPRTLDMSDPEQVRKLMCYIVQDQTLGTKKLENPEYYKNRYPTGADLNAADVRDSLVKLVCARVVTHLAEFGMRIILDLSLPPALDSNMVAYRDCSEAMAFKALDSALAEKEGAAPTKSETLLVTDRVLQCLGKDPSEAAELKFDVEEHLFKYYTLCIEDTLLPTGSRATALVKEAGLESVDAIFIDGKPVADFLKATFPKEEKPTLSPKNSAAIAIALVSGKHRIDVVNSYRDDQGNMKFEAKSIKPQVLPESEEAYMSKFSWIHRNLFNWGPWVIEPYQSVMERAMAIYAEDPNEAERHASICNQMKDRVQARFDEKAKEKEKSEREAARTRELRQKMENEKTRLKESVTKWDPESTIGIVGDAVKDLYMPVMQKLVSNIKERYDNMAPLFAKQVLYGRMCLERAQNGGEPGETELGLKGDGSKETILQNLEDAAQKMANDPIYNKLIYDRLGTPSYGIKDYTELSLSKFKELMAGGGCERFALEYMNRIKDAQDQMAQDPTELAKNMEKSKEGAEKQALPTG